MKTKLNIIKGLGILILVAGSIIVKAQQDPMYTQYAFNTQTINPAYAGTWESMSFMVLGRNQWVGIDGAPQTYTFSMQAPFKNEKFALGLNLISDKVGFEKRFYMFADYSYMLQVTEKSRLRLGLKGGFTSYSNNLLEYETNAPGSGTYDPAFQGEISRKFVPNFGIGAFLYSNNYYVGFSIPKILSNDFENNYNNYSVTFEMRHYYLVAGYVFILGENLKFKPATLVKASFSPEASSPIQADLSANFLIKERVWLGASYRTGDSFGFIAQLLINQKLRVGYAYDYTISNLQHFNSGTHEIMVSYEIRMFKDLASRYF